LNSRIRDSAVSLELTSRPSKVPLRALPLGASTVFGVILKPEDERGDGDVALPEGLVSY
jgi:hypothetical protein